MRCAQSATVNGTPQLFMPAYKAGSIITLTLRNVAARYGFIFDQVTVSIGTSTVTSTFVHIGFDTRITFLSPSLAPLPAVAVTVSLQSNQKGTIATRLAKTRGGDNTHFAFRDLSAPVIAAIAPAQAPFRGNAIMVIGVLGVPAIFTLNAVKCTFGGNDTRARVYGVVPLREWEAQQGAYAALMTSPDVLQFMSGLSVAMSAEYMEAAKRTSEMALLSFDQNAADRLAAIVLVQVCSKFMRNMPASNLCVCVCGPCALVHVVYACMYACIYIQSQS
jgi:hypothetical protein